MTTLEIRRETLDAEDNNAAKVDSQLAIDLLRQGKSVEIVVGGGSMWPLIRQGDRLLIIPHTPQPAPKKGSLIAVSREGRLVIHRLVATQPRSGTLLLQGDNLPAPDPPIPLTDVLGVVSKQTLSNQVVLEHQSLALLCLNRALLPLLKVGRGCNRRLFAWRQRKSGGR